MGSLKVFFRMEMCYMGWVVELCCQHKTVVSDFSHHVVYLIFMICCDISEEAMVKLMFVYHDIHPALANGGCCLMLVKLYINLLIYLDIVHIPL